MQVNKDQEDVDDGIAVKSPEPMKKGTSLEETKKQTRRIPERVSSTWLQLGKI